MKSSMEGNTERLIEALERQFPNGEWKKYIHIAADKESSEIPTYGSGISHLQNPLENINQENRA
jgi:hypothetical protein